MKVMLIINPRAGKMKSKTALYDIAEIFCLAGYETVVKITSSKGQAEKYAFKAAEEGFDAVVCCGGDGTLNETISGVISSGKKIFVGYVPAGSTNDFAKTLGLSNVPKQAAKNIVDGKPCFVDVGKFGEDRFFSYIASFGLFTATSYNTSQATKNVMGHFAYVLEGIKELGVVQPYHIKATADGKTYEGDYIFGAVTNSTSVGGIVKLESNMVDLNDGQFEVVLVKNPKDVTELTRVLMGIANSDLKDPLFDFFKCSEITIETEEDFSWSLDGEEASGDKKITIKNIKSAINILK
ncbi:MAG: diacylglycerol kinase family lipid kinase [Clostridia bacterium]|nr:diacylglycerol kinase family lipid kinase [Clostridia bacterium]